jgi:hypothetical protein
MRTTSQESAMRAGELAASMLFVVVMLSGSPMWGEWVRWMS